MLNQQAAAPYDRIRERPSASSRWRRARSTVHRHRYARGNGLRAAIAPELAQTLCGTSIAMVSLVYHDRQWFKARVGTVLDWIRAT